ncbi:MAG: hypothetical protein V3S48_02225 [Candidatus Neomarinimicrobiota bacterium]
MKCIKKLTVIIALVTMVGFTQTFNNNNSTMEIPGITLNLGAWLAGRLNVNPIIASGYGAAFAAGGAIMGRQAGLFFGGIIGGPVGAILFGIGGAM